MSDYLHTYLKLFNAVTDSINILKEAQSQAKELLIAHEEQLLKLLEEEEEWEVK